MHFLGQQDRRVFAIVEPRQVWIVVEKVNRLNFEPGRRSRNPTSHLFGRSLMRKLVSHDLRHKDLFKE